MNVSVTITYRERCDLLFPLGERNTFVNEAINSFSAINYIISSSAAGIVGFNKGLIYYGY